LMGGRQTPIVEDQYGWHWLGAVSPTALEGPRVR
jgi:hypothetical protein